ncbi:cation/H(+) antiporter 15 [Manihot esculenta]|uniref:Uncharacterized protein n=1 Tax=Manihot esculenta TaxID=3983 RepID=A0ACB7G323_MANES|nr:cation/H(+) antiporter 15 [Manihot esculenta]KAG8634662.1 hypothetical protein MANES_17G068100v8 [Manihot esculenta]
MDINNPQNFYHIPENTTFHCYIVNITAENGFWQSENPLTQSLPLLAWQLSIVIMINRLLFYLFKPLGTPRIVTDILGGLVMGPSALSKTYFFAVMFPLRSIFIVETMAYWALTCHLFLAGLEMDMSSIFRSGKKSISIAVVGTLLPFIIGIALHFISNGAKEDPYRSVGCIFWGATLTVTSYPVVARVLADQKLLHTDIGRLAMSISIVSELFTWLLLAVLIPARVNAFNAILSLASTAGFTVFCVTLIRPALGYVISKTANGNKHSEYYLSSIFVLISFFSLVSDMLGTTSIVGAFIFGIIMPNRELASELLEKFDDFVNAYMLPLFFSAVGISLEIWKISNWALALLLIILCCGAKIVSIFLASHYYKLPPQDGFALGVLMNTKGILAFVVLHMGINKSLMREEEYAIMVLSLLLMTGAVPSIISSIYHPSKRHSQYKQRTIQKARPDSEFKFLACFQSNRNVSGMINILDCSNASKESSLNVFALHLIELTGRASAMVIVHNPNKRSNSRKNAYSEQIISSLTTYANLNEFVTVQHLTALSPFATMHEDICSLAEDKEVSFLILPFHKLPTPDGRLEEDGSTSFRGVNLNVLANAPCTVGIFVDRGFGATAESNLAMRQIAMLFIGGPDDCEALSYAWRMSMNHGVCLTVIRFILGDRTDLEVAQAPVGSSQRSVSTNMDKQRRLDDEFVNEFRLKSAGEQFVFYEEKVANNDEELIAALSGMHHVYDLYVVGRGEGMNSVLTAGLMDWCEYPELGAMGDLLVTSSFAQGSVMVLQQYNAYKDEDEDEDENEDEDGTDMVDIEKSTENGREQ